MRGCGVLGKVAVFVAVVGGLSLSASAQTYYADVGIGVGGGFTSIDGNDVAEWLGSGVSNLAVEVGVKFGYGLSDGLYGTFEFGGIGHRFYDDYNYLQFNSYIVGPGVVFYPAPAIQLAGSVGYSFTDNDTDIPLFIMYNSTGGFAWNVSGGYEFGVSGANKALVGVKVSGAYNKLETSKADMSTTAICAFVRYLWRN